MYAGTWGCLYGWMDWTRGSYFGSLAHDDTSAGGPLFDHLETGWPAAAVGGGMQVCGDRSGVSSTSDSTSTSALAHSSRVCVRPSQGERTNRPSTTDTSNLADGHAARATNNFCFISCTCVLRAAAVRCGAVRCGAVRSLQQHQRLAAPKQKQKSDTCKFKFQASGVVWACVSVSLRPLPHWTLDIAPIPNQIRPVRGYCRRRRRVAKKKSWGGVRSFVDGWMAQTMRKMREDSKREMGQTFEIQGSAAGWFVSLGP